MEFNFLYGQLERSMVSPINLKILFCLIKADFIEGKG
jgi:hypothetical protein